MTESPLGRRGLLRERPWLFWFLLLAGIGLFLYLVRGILLPFVAGMVLAYFLDPLVDRLERLKLSRLLGTVIVMLTFLSLIALAVGLLAPMIVAQAGDLISAIPEYFNLLRDQSLDLLGRLSVGTGVDLRSRFSEAFASAAEGAAGDVTSLLTSILQGGLALANIISLVLITPLVAFFLLLHWDEIVAKINALLPHRYADTLRDLARQIDSVLSGFLRGQATVCGVMAVYYATALTVAGLDYGLIVGLMAGLLTFVPYIGSITGLVLTLGLSLIQFDSLGPVVLTVGLYLAGQGLEGNVITPRLVGRQIQLHDVWVLFAVLAGGALFGFWGVLVAVPIAGCIGVLVRFALARYVASPFYRDDGRS